MSTFRWQCGDGYCLVGGRASGMHTNGGCRCLLDLKPIEKRRAVQQALVERDQLRTRVEELERALVKAKDDHHYCAIDQKHYEKVQHEIKELRAAYLKLRTDRAMDELQRTWQSHKELQKDRDEVGQMNFKLIQETNQLHLTNSALRTLVEELADALVEERRWSGGAGVIEQIIARARAALGNT